MGLRIRDRIDPARAEHEEAARLDRQERDAHDRRYLRMREDGHGSTHGNFRLASVEAAVLRAVLDVLAKPQPSTASGRDPQTAEQRMADALMQMARLCQLKGELPATGGDRPTVVVTIAYPWLLDQLRGHGLLRSTDTPISPAAARRLACDAGILPMILGGDRQPLDVGRAQRFFTKAQRHAIAARDKHCIHPGCDRPATWCRAQEGKMSRAPPRQTLGRRRHHQHQQRRAAVAAFTMRLYDHDEWVFICDEHGPTHVVPPTLIDLDQAPIPINRE